MGIRFYCQHCQGPLNVKADQAGTKCKCAYCNGSITVPDRSEVKVRKRRRRKKKRSKHGETEQHVTEQHLEGQDARSEATVRKSTAATEASQLLEQSRSSVEPAESGWVPQLPDDGSDAHSLPSTAPTGAPSHVDQANQANQLDGSFLLDKPQQPAGTAEGKNPVDQDPDKVWYIRHPINGETGPIKGKVLKAMIGGDELTSDCHVWREDWDDWLIAGNVFPQLGLPSQQIPSATDGVFSDPNYQIPESLNPLHAKKTRQRRKLVAGIVAILAGIVTIIGLTLFLVYLISK